MKMLSNGVKTIVKNTTLMPENIVRGSKSKKNSLEVSHLIVLINAHLYIYTAGICLDEMD